eukprot:TRINITY_DN31787_c0_g1_i1.p1 TRINITY_DN31787_c0_g1~~TRINITY_DN31787_c0_g1_i1.p1  ORF type:complete len:262 (+),score=44.39 TRINITY_DN31787_c0_g1_i1:54-839(+)
MAAKGDRAPMAKPTLEELFFGNKMHVDDEQKLHMIFTMVDKDRNQTIELGELQDGLRILGLPVSPKKVAEMFHLADTNRDGKIAYDEFAHFFKFLPKMVEMGNILPADLERKCVQEPEPEPELTSRSMRRISLSRKGSTTPGTPFGSSHVEDFDHTITLKELFSSMDSNVNGTIEAQELRRGLLDLGCDLSEQRIAGMFQAADRDHNGHIDFNEFCTFFQHLPHLAHAMQLERLKRSRGVMVADSPTSVPSFRRSLRSPFA